MPDPWPPAVAEFEPFDFSVEAGAWLWFEPMEDPAFDEDCERLATLPRELYDALTGHLPPAYPWNAAKEYPTRESALDALHRALAAGTYTEPVAEPVTVTTGSDTSAL